MIPNVSIYVLFDTDRQKWYKGPCNLPADYHTKKLYPLHCESKEFTDSLKKAKKFKRRADAANAIAIGGPRWPKGHKVMLQEYALTLVCSTEKTT
jgi:hypothetical protein